MKRADRILLAILLPVWLCVFTLQLYALSRTGLTGPAVFVGPTPSDQYPRVAGPRRAQDDVRIGDRLLRVGDADLRGAGYFRFRALVLQQAGTDRSATPLVLERDGSRIEVALPLARGPGPLLRIPYQLALVAVAVLVLLQAGASSQGRNFFLAALGFTIWQTKFMCDLPALTYLQDYGFLALGGPAIFLLLRWAILFPDETSPRRRLPLALAWTGGALWLLPRALFLLGGPLPLSRDDACLAVDLILVATLIGILGWNFFRSSPVERRRISWVVVSFYVALCPIGIAFVLQVLGWPGRLYAIELGVLARVAIPLGVLIAVVRHNLFDIPRLMSATTSYSAAVIGVGGAGLFVLPNVVNALVSELQLNRRLTQAGAAWLIAFLVFFASRRIRPVIDRTFFPERQQLTEDVRELLEEIRECRTVADLNQRIASRLTLLFGPRTCRVYPRGRHGFAAAGDVGALSEWAVRELERQPRILLLGSDGAPRAGRRLPWVRTAAKAEGPLLLPLHGSELVAVIALGPKTSGDEYTGLDLTLLQAVADQASTELRRLQRARFLADVSHDLRQPVHALGLFAETLREVLGEPERARELVERICDSHSSLSTMLDDLLDWSRLEAGGLQVEMADIALAPLCARLHAELGALASAKGLALRLRPTSAVVRSDPRLLERILRNLISNAIRYTDKGRVVIGCRRRGRCVAIEVHDTGVGIAEADRAAVFQAFTQLRASGPDRQGLGLGLAIVDGMAQLLDHPLELTSRPGVGSRFAIVVPCVGFVRDRARPSSLLSGSALAERRVWVIDDDVRVRVAMQQLLETWGLRVRVHASAAAATADASAHAAGPDVILADLSLETPRAGLTAIAEIRRRIGRDVPAVIVSGEMTPEALEEITRSGLPYLRKPVAAVRLRMLLEHVLRNVPAPPPAGAGDAMASDSLGVRA